MSRRTLVDTGPIVAILSSRDSQHQRCVEALTGLPSPLSTCWPVITEACYLLGIRENRLRGVLEQVILGNLQILPLDETDVTAIDAILARFADQGFSVADASLMHLAEREGIDEVFTIDHKDFSVFRTSDGRSLTLIG